MIFNFTNSKFTALARRLTFSIDASGIRTAFAIGSTAQLRSTFNVRISYVAAETATVNSMVNGIAFCIVAARILLARANATPIQAVTKLIRRTILVVLTHRLIVQDLKYYLNKLNSYLQIMCTII